jgi:regulator of replication initiation timing
MSQSILQRRLVDVSERLKRIRAELAVTEEQALFLEEEAERQRLRALVAETPLADVEARDARRHADALAHHRDSLRTTVRELLREQDTLLDRISAQSSAR